MPRKSGWYWIRHTGSTLPEPAYYNTGSAWLEHLGWWLSASERVRDDHVSAICETPLEPPHDF